MKNLKKLALLSLAAIMAISMVACGKEKTPEPTSDASSPTTTDETPAAEMEPEEELGSYTIMTDENGNPYDLGGMEIVLGDWWSSGEIEEPTNAYEEARLEYLDWIQETYNFTIKEQAISSWGDMPTDFVNFATTGGTENYVFVLRQGTELVSAMRSGLMYDLSTIDCLDFSEKKWGGESGVHELLSKGEAIYGMRGIVPEPRAGIYFNKRLLEEAGINPQDIYDYQENMEWTWDKYEELCQQVQADTDNDGVIDRYAMTNFSSILYDSAVYSNGGEYIGKDDTGYVSRLESDETIEALNWGLDLISKYEMVYPEDAAWDYTFTAFANGEAVFSAAEAHQAGTWTTMEDDFGFVSFPMGPKKTDYTNSYSNNVFVIPACYDAERAWNIAFAYNLYTEPIPGFEDYAGWKTNFYKNFRDTEAVDLTLTRMMENGMVTYHTMIPGLDMGPDLIWDISKDSTPAQQAEKIRNTWASYLEDANK